MMKELPSTFPVAPLRQSTGLLLSIALVAACSSGGSGVSDDDDQGAGPGNTELSTLSGLVLDPTGAGLANVTVSAEGNMALSNALGQYVLNTTGNFSTENLHVVFDGSSAGLPGQFPEVGIDVDLPSNVMSATVPQVITLPDLLNPEASIQTVMTSVDGSVDQPIQVIGTEADMVLSGPIGTIIAIDGNTNAQMVDLNMTPVAPGQVPMLLPDNLLGGGFVTIQPGASTFDPPGPELGLDAMLPNDLSLPVGSTVDIWSFDHDESAWVNRSDETGQQGTVVDLGGGQTAIQATGVITEGGWHTPAVDVDPDCATTFTVRAVDTSTGLGVPDVVVQITTTGQVGITDGDGRVTIPMVWAYDVGLLADEGACVTTDLSYFLFFPLGNGFKTSEILTVPASAVVAGGVTDAGDFECDVPSVGTLSGIVIGNGQTASEQVVISNANGQVTSVLPEPGGTFFVTNLEAGDYVASFNCVGDDPLLQVPFTISIGQVTTVVLQCVTGTGSGDIAVLATIDGDLGNGLAGIPLPGAMVTLQGTDAGSLAGLVMITDSAGRAVFEDVNGPFNVTVQDDRLFGDDEFRLGQSVMNVSPVNDTIGVVVQTPNFFALAPTEPTVVSVSILNPPSLGANQQFLLQSVGTSPDGQSFRFTGGNFLNNTFTTLTPANTPTGFALILADVTSGQPIPIRTAFFANQGSFPADQQNSLSLDWGSAEQIAWDQPVSITLDNTDPDIDLNEFQVILSFRSITGQAAFQIPVGAPGSNPFNLSLPDVTGTPLADFQVSLDAAANPNLLFFDFQQGCSQDLESNESTRALTFPNSSNLIQPTILSTFSIDEFQNLLITWALGDQAGPDGFATEQVQFLSGLDQGSAGLSLWTINTRAGTTGFSLPPRALPMTSPNQSVFGGVIANRFDADGFEFDSLYSDEAANNLEQLYTSSDQRCRTSELVVFGITE